MGYGTWVWGSGSIEVGRTLLPIALRPLAGFVRFFSTAALLGECAPGPGNSGFFARARCGDLERNSGEGCLANCRLVFEANLPNVEAGR